MQKAAPMNRTAQDLFAEQLPLTAWETAETGLEMMAALESAFNGTHEQIRSQYPGDLLRLNACDALFRQAKAGLSLTAAALDVPQEEAAVLPEQTDMPADVNAAQKPRTPNVLHAAVLTALIALFLLCAVLLRYTTMYGTVDIPVRFFTDSMIVLMLLMALWEVLFRVGKLRTMLDEDGVGGLIYRLGKMMKWQWLSGIGLGMRQKYRQRLPQWQFTPAAVVVKQAVPDKVQMLEKCRTLLQIIDSNLPLFATPRQTAQKAEYSPVLRALIQEYYNNREGMSDELKATLTDTLHLNGWTLLDYSPEHEAMFTTQPMTETFTIFPAILDRQHQLIETGFACVKEG